MIFESTQTRLGAAAWAMVATAMLAGCASGPKLAAPEPIVAAPPPAPSPEREAAEPRTVAELIRVPDAEPVVEPVRASGPNKPYVVQGQSYMPFTKDLPFTERGVASWYGRPFHGRRTASGEVYNMYAMTAAHPTLPIPSYVRVRNAVNGREVVLRINDRGPFHGGRIIDLSYTAAVKLDLHRGIGRVEIARITYDDIRTGAWRREALGEGLLAVVRAEAQGSASTALAPSTSPQDAVAATEPASMPTSTPGPGPAGVPPASVGESMAAAPVADAPAARAFTAPARGFWVQLGAFRDHEGAQSFHSRVVSEADWLSPLLAVFSDAALYRLQAGPYATRLEASAAAERVRDSLRLVPMIVQRK